MRLYLNHIETLHLVEMFPILTLPWLIFSILIQEAVCDYKGVSYRKLVGRVVDLTPTPSPMARQSALPPQQPSVTTPADICDAECNLDGFEVNIYYWPEPDANMSCLSIVGDNYDVPLQGATTDQFGNSIWGCTTQNSVSVPLYVTTAIMTTIGGHSLKESLFNPWHSVVCSTNGSSLGSPSPSSNSSLHSSLYRSIHARGHSLIVPTSMIRNNSLPITTVVSGTLTLSVNV